MNDRHSSGSTPDTGRDPMDTPLLTVLRHFEAEGFTEQFNAREGGVVHCYSCQSDSPAEDCANGQIRRLEGASDPADMLAVVPVHCPRCDALGVVVMNYGPEASVADAEVLLALEWQPSGGEPGG